MRKQSGDVSSSSPTQSSSFLLKYVFRNDLRFRTSIDKQYTAGQMQHDRLYSLHRIIPFNFSEIFYNGKKINTRLSHIYFIFRFCAREALRCYFQAIEYMQQMSIHGIKGRRTKSKYTSLRWISKFRRIRSNPPIQYAYIELLDPEAIVITAQLVFSFIHSPTVMI